MRRNSCENFKVIQGDLLKSFKIKREQGGKLIPFEKLLSLKNSKTELKVFFRSGLIALYTVHAFLETGCEKHTKEDISKRYAVTM